jgi:hypothetical protein
LGDEKACSKVNRPRCAIVNVKLVVMLVNQVTLMTGFPISEKKEGLWVLIVIYFAISHLYHGFVKC